MFKVHVYLRHMNKRYCYLYALSHNGYVFYIGISRHPHARYMQHCTQGQNYTWDVYNYIYWILEAGELPDIHIIDHYENKYDAEEAENLLIRHYSALKHKLCNGDKNPPCNRLITCIPDNPKSRRNKIGYADFVRDRINEHHKTYWINGKEGKN